MPVCLTCTKVQHKPSHSDVALVGKQRLFWRYRGKLTYTWGHITLFNVTLDLCAFAIEEGCWGVNMVYMILLRHNLILRWGIKRQAEAGIRFSSLIRVRTQ